MLGGNLAARNKWQYITEGPYDVMYSCVCPVVCSHGDVVISRLSGLRTFLDAVLR